MVIMVVPVRFVFHLFQESEITSQKKNPLTK